ncbi:MAG TPA: DUF748 domain-containing protein [Verrucomicrobiae bacterium]|nr:DUF748 domain-containing protein [Verrucomicrobiae bacterium]
MKGTRSSDTPARPQHRCLRVVGIILLIFIIALCVGRAILPWYVQNYVNRTLHRDALYSGRIGKVHVHLLRGAYSIDEVRISKTTGDVPVPFFAARRVDFAVQWNALFHRKIVGRVLMENPEINFVDAESEQESQNGTGAPWLQMIRDLFPFKINSAQIQEGSVHFRSYKTAEPLDVYLSHVNGSIENLSNVRDEINPLVATVQATAKVMDQANLEFKMTLDPFSYRPTFHLALRLLGLDVTKINELALAYGKFDFKRGWFDLVVEADSKEGQMSGYVKPLFRNLKVFSLSQDIKQDNALEFFWQALLGAVTDIFKNHPRDQFGTLIPFSADESTATTANILATIGNVLRNAFVRAYLPRLQSGQEAVEGLQFSAPSFTEDLSTSDSAQ